MLCSICGIVITEPLDGGPSGHLVGSHRFVGGGDDDPLTGGDVPVSISPTLSVSQRLARSDPVIMLLDRSHGDHPGQVFGVVTGNGEVELGFLFLATPGIYSPGANWSCQACRELSSTSFFLAEEVTDGSVRVAGR